LTEISDGIEMINTNQIQFLVYSFLLNVYPRIISADARENKKFVGQL
jgi:hypothetical protein